MGDYAKLHNRYAKRYKRLYDDTKYGRPFLSSRFLKMTESDDSEGMVTVFDMRKSEFQHYADAAIDHTIDLSGKAPDD